MSFRPNNDNFIFRHDHARPGSLISAIFMTGLASDLQFGNHPLLITAYPNAHGKVDIATSMITEADKPVPDSTRIRFVNLEKMQARQILTTLQHQVTRIDLYDFPQSYEATLKNAVVFPPSPNLTVPAMVTSDFVIVPSMLDTVEEYQSYLAYDIAPEEFQPAYMSGRCSANAVSF